MRVLIDTNILISASLSSTGTPYKAYIRAVTYPNHGMVCDQNIDELRRVYNRKFPHKIQALERFLSLSLTVLEVVPTPVVDEFLEAGSGRWLQACIWSRINRLLYCCRHTGGDTSFEMTISRYLPNTDCIALQTNLYCNCSAP